MEKAAERGDIRRGPQSAEKRPNGARRRNEGKPPREASWTARITTRW